MSKFVGLLIILCLCILFMEADSGIGPRPINVIIKSKNTSTYEQRRLTTVKNTLTTDKGFNFSDVYTDNPVVSAASNLETITLETILWFIFMLVLFMLFLRTLDFDAFLFFRF